MQKASEPARVPCFCFCRVTLASDNHRLMYTSVFLPNLTKSGWIFIFLFYPLFLFSRLVILKLSWVNPIIRKKITLLLS